MVPIPMVDKGVPGSTRLGSDMLADIDWGRPRPQRKHLEVETVSEQL